MRFVKGFGILIILISLSCFTFALPQDSDVDLVFNYPINYTELLNGTNISLNVNYSETTNCWSTIEGIKCDVSDILGSEITNDDGWISDITAESIYDLIDVTDSATDLDFLQWNQTAGVWQPVSLETVYYNATSATAVTGTVAGSLTDTQHPDGNYDEVSINITEQVSAPALDVRVNFTNGITSFNAGVMRYRTEGTAGDEPIIQLWDYDESEWEDYPKITRTENWAIIEQSVFDDDSHVLNGTVQMRLYKATNGNINNKYFIDWLAISRGYGTPAGEEVDPNSIHKDGTVTWEGNDDHGGYNITNVSYINPDGETTNFGGDVDLGDNDLTTTGAGTFRELQVGDINIDGTSISWDGFLGTSVITSDGKNIFLSPDTLFSGKVYLYSDSATNSLYPIITNTESVGTSANRYGSMYTKSLDIKPGTSTQAFKTVDVTGGHLGIQSQNSGANMLFNLFSKDGDATDLVLFEIWGKGRPSGGVAGEGLAWGWYPVTNQHIISGFNVGGGSLREITMGVSPGALDQILLKTDGDVSFKKGDVHIPVDNKAFTWGATDTDLQIYSDGTNPVYNSTGVHTFYNTSGLGTIRYGNALTSTTIDSSTTALEEFNLGSELYNEDGSINHSAFGDCFRIVNDTDFSRPELEFYIEEIGNYQTNEIENVTMNRTIYPHTKETEVVDLTCEQAQQRQALALINENIDVYDNLTDFDTGIMAENIYTQSKVINLIENYALKFLNSTTLSSKKLHKNKEVLILPNKTIEVLSVEDRIVDLEGAFSDHMTCMYANKKYDDYRNCMLDINPKDKIK